MGQSPALNQPFLTKGDNNPVDDIDLYNGTSWLKRIHIVSDLALTLFMMTMLTVSLFRFPHILQ